MRRAARAARTVAIAGLALAAAACHAPTAENPQALDPAAATQPLLEFSVGQTRTISLPAHGGTGFEWAPTASSLEDAAMAIRERGSQAVQPGVAGGTVQWSFQVTALQPGRGALTFELRRPWEKDVAPAETVVVPYLSLRPSLP